MLPMLKFASVIFPKVKFPTVAVAPNSLFAFGNRWSARKGTAPDMMLQAQPITPGRPYFPWPRF